MTGAHLWILMAIHPNADMSFVSVHPTERFCRQEAVTKSLQSKRFLPQPISYTCIQATPIQGSAR